MFSRSSGVVLGQSIAALMNLLFGGVNKHGDGDQDSVNEDGDGDGGANKKGDGSVNEGGDEDGKSSESGDKNSPDDNPRPAILNALIELLLVCLIMLYHVSLNVDSGDTTTFFPQ